MKIFIIIFLLLLTGCGESERTPLLYAEGQVVYHKLTGEKCLIVDAYYAYDKSPRYYARMQNMQLSHFKQHELSITQIIKSLPSDNAK